MQPRYSGYGLCDVVTRSLSREFPWLVRLLTTFASAIYNYAYSRVFQHPLERALNRRARNAQATMPTPPEVNETWQLVALVELCSMSISSLRGQITAFGLYCPLTDLSSSALGHTSPAVMLNSVQHRQFPPEKKDGYSTITQRTEKPYFL